MPDIAPTSIIRRLVQHLRADAEALQLLALLLAHVGPELLAYLPPENAQ